MLVEYQNKEFPCSGFICVNEKAKCAKYPNIDRVKEDQLTDKHSDILSLVLGKNTETFLKLFKVLAKIILLS